MLESTSKFEVIEIIHKSENFAIAKGYWDHDKSKLRVACRWYEPDGMGYPQTFGKPQWMMLPEEIKVNILDALRGEKASIQLTFESK